MRTDFVAIEKEILQAAINELKKRTGASVKHLSIDRYTGIAAHLEINFGKISYEFYVEIKGEVHKTTMERIIDQFQSPKNQWLLVAKYIPGPLKEYLKTNGYNYLEATGNCYIRMDQILLHINDQEVKHVSKTATGKLWKSTGTFIGLPGFSAQALATFNKIKECHYILQVGFGLVKMLNEK